MVLVLRASYWLWARTLRPIRSVDASSSKWRFEPLVRMLSDDVTNFMTSRKDSSAVTSTNTKTSLTGTIPFV